MSALKIEASEYFAIVTNDAMAPLTIFPYQEIHVEVLKEHLKISPFAIDLSMLGTGKTYTSAKIGEDLGVKHIVVICPVSVKAKWQHMKKEYGIPLKDCISFCQLRSTKCKQPKHGLLKRRDYQESVRVNHQMHLLDRVDFSASDSFKALVDEGLLLVIDEVQNIKNITSQFHACQALIAEIVKRGVGEGAKSRLLLVSGSPIDKREQSVNMFRCLGVMRSTELTTYNIGTYQFVPTGILEIEAFCKNLSPEHAMFGLYSRTHTHSKNLCMAYAYRMFQEVFKRRLSHAMDPPKADTHLVKRNGEFIVEREQDRLLLEAGIGKLKKACGFDPDNNTVNFGTNSAATMSGIQVALMQIETAKIHTFVRIARKALESDPNKKVVICVNYCATIADLKGLLVEYRPLLLQGSMSSNRRAEAIANFQKGDCEHRLLIANLSVCSTGIDLDDKFGTFEREVFVSPMYNTITLYQLCHRFQRMDTKSSSDIFMVYGKGAVESRVLAALGRKSLVMKETTENQVRCGVEFPGDYATVVEGEDGVMVGDGDGVGVTEVSEVGGAIVVEGGGDEANETSEVGGGASDSESAT